MSACGRTRRSRSWVRRLPEAVWLAATLMALGCSEPAGDPCEGDDDTTETSDCVDLDEDGYRSGPGCPDDELYVLNPDGTERAMLAPPQVSGSCSKSGPTVVDVDADGLAEILISGWGIFATVENPAGGWYVEGADEPWPAMDKHPGDRTVTGEIPPPTDVHWSDPRTNVWQGLPAGDATLSPQADLEVDSIDVCFDEENSTAHVTAYVANRGPLQTAESVVVFLRSLSDQTFLGEEVVQPPLMPGTATAIQFVVPAADVISGCEVTVDELGSVVECDEGDNVGTWTP